MPKFSGSRPPAVAGRFYPGDPGKLRTEVDGMLDAAPDPVPDDNAVGGVSPHAGYAFSGRLAARVCKALKHKRPKTIVLLGTAHHEEVGGLALPDTASFATPLGEVPVDTGMAEALLAAHPEVKISPAAHAREHSLEVQLPFLQRAHEGAHILPLLTGVKNRGSAEELGRELGRLIKERDALLIVATDLSHFPSDSGARRSDLALLAALEKMDADFLWDADRALMRLDIPQLHCTACGLGAAAVGITACLELDAGVCEVLQYANSYDISGDAERVVGYGAALFKKGARPDGPFFGLGEQEKSALLKLARAALAEYLRTGKEPAPRAFDLPLLNLPGAAFVTWTERSASAERELRGCVGTTLRDRTIGNCVAHFAVRSAVSDTRFTPVAAADLPALHAEVSVLSPSRPSTAEAVRPGQGVVFELGRARGLFLPLMWERYPDKEKFMNVLAGSKAGAREDAWRDPAAKLWTFEAEAFGEEE
ncbi:MAG: AmmeMemoRadiSam system protein B [Elusimicrobiota bacterium]